MQDARVPIHTVPEQEWCTVELGSRVRVRDTDGEHEHTVVARAPVGTAPGCVSVGSPVGRALLGRRAGDKVEVQSPGGVRLLTVVAVVAEALPTSPRSARTCEG
jgi:transcription elongation GreA/GreB family factor